MPCRPGNKYLHLEPTVVAGGPSLLHVLALGGLPGFADGPHGARARGQPDLERRGPPPTRVGALAIFESFGPHVSACGRIRGDPSREENVDITFLSRAIKFGGDTVCCLLLRLGHDGKWKGRAAPRSQYVVDTKSDWGIPGRRRLACARVFIEGSAL